MKLKEVKEPDKDQWILVEVVEEDQEGNPIEVNLLKHSPRREQTYEAMQNIEDGKYVYHFYNGKIPKEGYAVAF